MPRQGISVVSCLIGEWMKREGDPVKAGDILFTYETDKAAFEEESPIDGVLLKRLYGDGDEVPCLQTVCIIGEPGEDIADLLPREGGMTGPVGQAGEDAKETAAPAAAPPPAPAAGERKVSPRARNLAERSHADLARAVGSGPEGRIIERDVAALIRDGKKRHAAEGSASIADTPADSGGYTDIPLSNMRRLVGKAMHESLMNMAQLTLHASFDATEVLAFRKAVKARGEETGLCNITINDIILYAVSRILLKHPNINAHYMEDHVRQFYSANIGIAADTDRGLMVPTLFGADGMSLNEVSLEAGKLIDAARSGQISPDLLTGGTFTVTNLGVLGVEAFTPVINPPQVAILGVCAVRTALREDGTPYPAMGLSLTFDHRATDGAPAARFLRDLARYLGDFSLSLAMESAR